MSMCPLCNGFQKISIPCSNCGTSMVNSGREAEYYDDYSPYMPIDMMKMEDGFPRNEREGKCPHLFICRNCGAAEVKLIKE
nr:hypothetical protein [Bacillus mediterraneensis]